MPLVLGAFLRYLVMAVASGAVVTFAQELLDGTFKTLVEELRDTEGITEQEAKDIVANILLDLALNSASIMFVLKSGVGVKVAEYLGLTSRNFGKAALSTNAEKAAVKLASTGGKDIARRVLVMIKKFVPNPVAALWLFMGFTQVIEPAIYQPAQTERIWQALGFDISIPRAEGNKTPGPFSSSSSVTFDEYARSLEVSGIKGISNPVAMQSQLYSRTALADVVNYVYGQQVSQGKKVSVNEIIPLIAPYLVMASGSTALPSPAVSTPTTTQTPKVYTGIVSQGVIGKGLTFTPRPDDLIESVEELKQAAANNLTPFLETVLGKIVYEVKIVSSIITKDGFKQTGTVQQIKTGTTTTGAPKYKTVVNKFATLNLYVMTDKGVRSKISTIVLGPTNSAKLTIGLNELKEIETALPSLVTTTDINDIRGIETANAVTVSTPVTAGGTPSHTPTTVTTVSPAAPVSAPASGIAVPGNTALTLFEWYLAQGKTLPSVAERAIIYESLGLGQKAFYTGTAEQNSKLLAALKQDAAAKAVIPTVAKTQTTTSTGKSSTTTTTTKATTTTKEQTLTKSQEASLQKQIDAAAAAIKKLQAAKK